jgi:hypothetical protein
MSPKLLTNITTKEEKQHQRQSLREDKENFRQTTFYWVGKESLKIWPTLAIKKYESQLPVDKTTTSSTINGSLSTNKEETTIESSSDNKEITELNEQEEQRESSECSIVKELQNGKSKKANNNECLNEKTNIGEETVADSYQKKDTCLSLLSDDEETDLNFFNEDIVCSHNNLSTTPNKRLVSANIWHQIFETYFYSDSNDLTKAKIFTNESKECKICQVNLFKLIMIIILILIIKFFFVFKRKIMNKMHLKR